MNPGIVRLIVKSARREHRFYLYARKQRDAVPHTEQYWIWQTAADHAKWAAFDHMCHAWLVAGRRPARDKILIRKIARAIKAKAEEEMRRAA